MTCPPFLAWRVVGWDARFETRGSLRKRGPRGSITVATDLDGDEMRRLLDASGGFLAFAVWNLVCRIAATCTRRGVLVKDDLPMTAAELARLARFPLNLIEPALQLLASPEIGLLERVPLQLAMTPPDVPEPLPRQPRVKPLLQCPVCSADLTEYYQLQTQTGETSNKSEAEGHVSTSGITQPVTAVGVTDEEAAGGPLHKNSGAKPPEVRICTNPATVSDPLHQLGNVPRPDRTWSPPATTIGTTLAEIQDVKRRFQSGQMSPAELCEFLTKHYYDSGQADDNTAPNEETNDWEDEADEWHEFEDEDWEDNKEFQTDLPPPKRDEWT